MSYVKNYEYGQNEEPETEEVCWKKKGYRRKRGTRRFSKGSCVKIGRRGRGRHFAPTPSEDEEDAFCALKF